MGGLILVSKFSAVRAHCAPDVGVEANLWTFKIEMPEPAKGLALVCHCSRVIHRSS